MSWAGKGERRGLVMSYSTPEDVGSWEGWGCTEAAHTNLFFFKKKYLLLSVQFRL